MLSRAVDSFRALSDSERGQIREDRIAIVKARAGETLAALLEQDRSRWPAGEAAVANATLPETPLSAGQSIKITRPVAHAG